MSFLERSDLEAVLAAGVVVGRHRGRAGHLIRNRRFVQGFGGDKYHAHPKTHTNTGRGEGIGVRNRPV